MEKNWILVIDSGVGGLFTLNKIKEVLPDENYLYFMDKLHAPYGNKSVWHLKKLTYNNIKKLLSLYPIKTIVLACNTLSSTCYDYINNKFKDIEIIKIEPFFDPVIFENKNTLLLATKNTIRYNQNLKKYMGYKNIFLHGFGDLAKRIDNANGSFDLLMPYLKKTLSKYKKYHIQNVVLGCTHFNYIKPQIVEIFGKVNFFENSEKIAKEVKIAQKSIKNDSKMQNLSKKKHKSGKTLMLYKI